MKKTIGLIGLFLLAFVFSYTATLAQSGEVSFFESMDNLQKLKNFTSQQVLSGEFDIEERGANGKGEFEFAVQSMSDKGDSDSRNAKSLVNGKIEVSLGGEDKPFDKIEARVRLSLISIEDKDHYVRLENAELNAEGVPDSDKESYREFKSSMADELSKIRGKWIHIPMEALTDKASAEVGSFGELADPEAFRKDLIENGLKKTLDQWIGKLVEDAKVNGGMSEEDANKALKARDRVLGAKFFVLRPRRGVWGNMVSFQFSRKAVLDLVKQISADVDEPVTESDLGLIRVVLSKFQISGSYRVDEKFRIFDRLRLKFSLRDVGPLKKGVLQITSQIGRVGQTPAVSVPEKFIELEDAELSFLPSDVSDDTSSEGVLLIEPELEPEPAME